MKPKVFVTRRIPRAGMEKLEQECEFKLFPEDHPLSKEELIQGVEGCDALLCMLNDRIDKEVMDASSRLKVIANFAVGYDNIDLEEATRQNIMVTNTPDVLTEATADLAWALLMAVSRRIVEADRFVRQGRFQGWGPMLLLGSELVGKTLGIIGFGRIGKAVARRARGFNMRILYFKRSPLSPVEEDELGVEYASLGEILDESDFISLHLPLTPETRYLIGEKELKRLKKGAIIINTARGPVVDEAALVDALQSGDIAGAGFDVYEHEPELTPGLAELDNVVLAPHIGSATEETRTKMALIAAGNILAVLKGEKPPHLVNRGVLFKP
ncbi:MAG: 2-hydroxyacid dehydrogenase [Dethiobacteria bacterium]|jgi:glyoxylate reductase|nr:D-glycerate dehydrogenase [Bacillota bacterium]